MTFLSFISSLIGGLVAVGVSHLLANRHARLMKRELYREVLYREKVAAYREVYALAANYIQNIKDPEIANEFPSKTINRALMVKQTIVNSGLFMPDEVMHAVGTFDEIAKHLIKRPALAKERFKLDTEPPEDFIIIMAWAEKFEFIIEILRNDLGVETLTKDLNEFFRTATLTPRWPEYWKKLVEYFARNPKADGKNNQP